MDRFGSNDHPRRKKHVVAFLRDITERKRAEKKIQELAFTDNLTGLFNRNYLEKLVADIEPDNQHHLAVVVIDVDNFKLINDTQGHLEGDRLLCKISKDIERFASAQIVAFRLGGDEFALVINGLPADIQQAEAETLQLAESIRKSIESVVVTSDIQFQISASIGIAINLTTETSYEGLLKKADIALYEAKESGRNRCFLFRSHMQQKLERQVKLETGLHSALAHNELMPYLQPQFDKSLRLTGAELLLRWQHPEYGIVSPAEFIPIAEETRSIIAIELWVIEYACQLLNAWHSTPETQQLQLAINISVVHFEQTGFIESLESILSNYVFDRKLLKLELTETVALVNPEKAIARMHLLKEKGLGISMDDFGIGHASLNYLRDLPIDQLKIDKSFIDRLTSDTKVKDVVNCIITLAKALGMQIIAEGVETQEQKTILESLGCDLYQGYLFSPAVPLIEFQRFIQENSAVKH